MDFAMYAFSSHVKVLHKVTPIDRLVQSAVLFSLTGWLCRIRTMFIHSSISLLNWVLAY